MSEPLPALILARDQIPRSPAAPAQAAAPADFASLYDQYYPRVFGYVMRTLMNRQAAEDVTGEAFLRAWRQFSSFEPRRGTFASWIYRIATNAMHDHFRKNRRLVSLESMDEPLDMLLARREPPEDAASRLEQLECYRRLHGEIEKLKPIYRIVIVLFYFEEKSVKEIARIVGTFVPTVRWRLHRARCCLARQLNQAGRIER